MKTAINVPEASFLGVGKSAKLNVNGVGCCVEVSGAGLQTDLPVCSRVFVSRSSFGKFIQLFSGFLATFQGTEIPLAFERP